MIHVSAWAAACEISYIRGNSTQIFLLTHLTSVTASSVRVYKLTLVPPTLGGSEKQVSTALALGHLTKRGGGGRVDGQRDNSCHLSGIYEYLSFDSNSIS